MDFRRRHRVNRPALPGEPPEGGYGKAPLSIDPRFSWQPFGYLRAQYITVQDDPNVAFVGRSDGFELQNARIGVRGELDRRVAFVISFDGAIDERTQVNTPQGKLGVGLRDAFLVMLVPLLGNGILVWLAKRGYPGDVATACPMSGLESRWKTPQVPAPDVQLPRNEGHWQLGIRESRRRFPVTVLRKLTPSLWANAS